MWKTIKGYEEYQISDKAVIQRCPEDKASRIINPNKASNGALYVTLWKNGKRKNYMLHKLYASAFGISQEEAEKIVYGGYTNSNEAKNNVRNWLSKKLAECEMAGKDNAVKHDEILYLKSFLEMMQST